MKKMKKILISIIILIQISNIFAQTKEYLAPHYMTSDELLRLDEIGKNFVETDPPEGDIRNIAEWEPMESVIVAYDYSFGIPYSLIAEMSEDCVVTTIVSGSSEENTVRNYYSQNGVNLDNCNFLYSPIDSWWTRDYTAWYIAIDNSEVAIIDFPYNRPRPNDDEMPKKMAEFLGIDWYGMDVINTGGNYMSDGYGVAAQTDLVYDENSISDEEVTQKIHDYLGIENYLVLPDPTSENIRHIDCWGKFLDVDKVLITQVPETDTRYEKFETVAAYFAETNCSYGYPYQVFRVQAADSVVYDTNPYTNSLILNNKVFVPQSGSSFDDEALEVYEQAMPGYEIHGVYSTEWYNTDALHCRTHEMADREMIYIKHYPIFDIVDSQDGYQINAEVYSYAGNEIETDFPKIVYSIDEGANFVEIVMEASTVKSGLFTAKIPQQEEGTIIYYYITAQDVEGKNANHPFIGEADPHIFTAGEESPVTQIVENKNEDYFNIYPNPCKGMFFTWIEVENKCIADVQIFSLSGNMVYSKQVELNTEENLKQFDVDFLNSGIYTVKIVTKNNSLTKKLIVQ